MKKESGFTLVELIIAISLMAVMLAASAGLFSPWGVFRDRISTENKLKELQQDLTAAYYLVSGVAETSTAEAGLPANRGSLAITSDYSGATQKHFNGTDCGLNIPTQTDAETAMEAVSDYFVNTTTLAARDGFGRPLCILISKQLSMDADTVSEGGTGLPTKIYFHKIYLLSKGANEHFDSHWDAATGTLLLNQDASGNRLDNSDDQAVVIDGGDIQYKLYRETVDKMRKVATAYRNYYRSEYLNSAQRDPIVNYFHNSKTVDPSTMAIGDKIGAMPFKDVNGSVPAIDRLFSASDPLGHFVALRVTRDVPVGAVNGMDYTNFDGQAALSSLGLTESETALPTRSLPSGITHVLINNAREESGIKTPDASLPVNRSAPYTVEVGSEIAPDLVGPSNRNVIKIQLGGSWE